MGGISALLAEMIELLQLMTAASYMASLRRRCQRYRLHRDFSGARARHKTLSIRLTPRAAQKRLRFGRRWPRFGAFLRRAFCFRASLSFSAFL